MEKINKNAIKIADFIAPVISSRDVTEIIKNAILKSDFPIMEIDFSNVEFISRSAAHAFILMKEDLQRRILKKKRVLFVNANKDVSQMLRIIAANRVAPLSKPDFHAEKIDITTLA